MPREFPSGEFAEPGRHPRTSAEENEGKTREGRLRGETQTFPVAFAVSWDLRVQVEGVMMIWRRMTNE